MLRAAYDFIKGDVWRGAKDSYKHCRVSCAMASKAGPNSARAIGDFNEFVDALAAEFGFSSVCDARDLWNNQVGIKCAGMIKAGKYANCHICCSCEPLE